MEKLLHADSVHSQGDIAHLPGIDDDSVPEYLHRTYWWAYLHPRAVRIFERQWLVNLILWGNFARLRDAALAELGSPAQGRVLQVACVYGDFSPRLAACLDAGAQLDVVDVAPIQLGNVARKLAGIPNVSLHCQDSTQLGFSDQTFDRVIVFFLLHEQPDAERRATIREALRVTKSGGKTVFVDYHRPAPWNPMRYFMAGVFWLLEPFAQDFWRRDIAEWAADALNGRRVSKDTLFGGLYQKTTFSR
jgi:ubiquinone/menaquinone biosynthesis C-methylase UbiE